MTALDDVATTGSDTTTVWGRLGIDPGEPRPAWAVLDAVRAVGFSGEVTMHLPEPVRLHASHGRIYWAERRHDADIVDRRLRHFDSIAVSGHKFFGFDEPLGLFVTTREVLARQNPFQVVYLNDAVPTITCSRSALGPLKFWWQIHRTGIDGYRRQARGMLQHAAQLEARLHAIGHPAWRNDCSNTVYFRRPAAWVMDKWGLAPGEDPRLGGPLAHDIVMRHEDLHTIDAFVRDLSRDRAGPDGRSAGRGP